jgi:hypothetical protein
MARRKWSDLSPESRRLIVIGGVLEAALKFGALADLRGRSRKQVRGPKLMWTVLISFVNAFGAVPVLYFLVGRRGVGAEVAEILETVPEVEPEAAPELTEDAS